MSDEKIQQQTGRSWSQWVALLDAFGAMEKRHGEIASHVASYGVSSWWSQSVSVGYERIRGLRAIGQRRSGSWEANKSRTFGVPVAKLFAAFANANQRAKWLPDVKLTVRTSIEDRSLRITWPDETDVQVAFVSKGDEKSTVTIQHAKLPEKETADRMKTFWSERLDALGELLG
ncbi:MAG TPA: hypothetical protein VE010_12325 [Thermoanaerobaculia bacterium]|nr:hypothetical protein [Thermoanaerobaculia bacterium]